MRNLVHLDENNDVDIHYKNIDVPPGPLGPKLLDVEGRPDGPDYMGRRYNAGADTFGPFQAPPVPRLDVLRGKPVLTPAERDELLQLVAGKF